MENVKIVAIHGSPRRNGNTATLLQKAVEGAQDSGAEVEEIVLRDLKMSPCLEIYYFFDVIDMKLWKALLYRGLDFEGDVLKFPEYIDEAYEAGKELAKALNSEFNE